MRQVPYPFKTTDKHALFVFQFIMSSDARQESKGL
jgi:hypothetical protein